MTKGSGTRSGMLWEVERILKECDNLPNILLMENVPQIHSQENKDDFILWQKELEKLGYRNYWQDLNGKDYLIPQNRNRTFMISILGDYYYEFPQKQKLVLRLKDLLESATQKGYAIANYGDGVYINRPEQKRGVVQKGMIQTLKTSCNDVGVVVNDNKNDTPQLIGGIGEKNSNGGTQYYQQNRIYSGECIAMCHPANLPSGSYMYGFEEKEKLRIRKLTSRECFRLMGVKDEDYDKIKPNQSESSLYHLAGDSIIVNVLSEIFKKLI